MADQDFARTASTGIFNVSSGLLATLACEPGVELIVLARRHGLGALPEGVAARSYALPTWSLAGRIAWDQWGVYRAAVAAGCEWLLLPKGYASFFTPCPVRLAVYLHDLIPLHIARNHPGAMSRWRVAYLERAIRASLQQAAVVYTNTEFTRGEILAWCAGVGVSPPPVVVAGYGFDIAPVRREKEDVVVVFYRRDPHKLPEQTLAHVSRWAESDRFTGRIVAIGDRLHEPARRGLGGQWDFVGRVSPTRCQEWMGRARVVVHFSEYEGFGMPPVEAVLAGTPPVYSRIGAMCEAMGDAGFAVPNGDAAAFARAMQEALACPERQVDAWAAALRQRHQWALVARRVREGLGMV